MCAGPPLHGVLHAGGVLADGTLAKQTLAGMRAVRSLRRALWMPRGRLRMGGFADV